MARVRVGVSFLSRYWSARATARIGVGMRARARARVSVQVHGQRHACCCARFS